MTPYDAFAGPPGGGYEPTPPPMSVAHPANVDPFHDAAGIPVVGYTIPCLQPQSYVSDGVKEAAKYQPPSQSYSQQPPSMALQPSVVPQQQSQQQKGVGARLLSTAMSLGGEDPYAAYTSALPSHDQFSANHSDLYEEDEDEDEESDDDDDYRYGRRRVLEVLY
ncbi:hypothetical protein BDY19DRAFT_1030339 [Irpex rosettiformis]|uniref:Uncharacterized protein n=1 Tax=Irpex rosettiformis TaxID=378272 RepID=A0ACB8TNX7_9APHY|nr:hypothetical protein BDY19DRAFT_1030339 [Irpex rosettiformis]